MSEEEVTTYSGLVRILRERIAGYVREGVERARADIDHVYHRCRKGLIDNLRLLKRLYDHLYTNGRPSRDGRLRLLGVGKAYGDGLYAYGVGRFPDEFDGLIVSK